MSEEAKVLLCGDSAVTVQFGETAKISINQKVRAFEQLLEFVEMFQVLQVVHRPFVRLVTVYWMEAASAR